MREAGNDEGWWTRGKREEGIGTEKGRTGVTGEDTRVNDGTLEEFLEGTSGAESGGEEGFDSCVALELIGVGLVGKLGGSWRRGSCAIVWNV